MPAIVIVGAQWGDEGKGKIVDIYHGARRHGRALRRWSERGAYARRR